MREGDEGHRVLRRRPSSFSVPAPIPKRPMGRLVQMADGTRRGPWRPAIQSATPLRGGLDSIAVSWYRWRLLSGYYDTPEVLDALAGRIVAAEKGLRSP